MKKLLLLALAVFLFAGASYAQEFKPFKVGLGLGYAVPGGEGAGGGVLFYAEPMYRIKDELAVGLRLEGAIVIRGVESSATSASFDAAAIASYTVNGQYYLMNGGFRPLVGAGFGLYNMAGASFSGDTNGNANEAVGSSTTVGFYPRAGFDAGHFNFLIEYNLIPSTELESTMGGESVKIKNSYFAVKIGASIGGGRRR